jgi:hypothetical protein
VRFVLARCSALSSCKVGRRPFGRTVSSSPTDAHRAISLRAPISRTVPFSMPEIVARLMPSERASSACDCLAARRAEAMVAPIVVRVGCTVYDANLLDILHMHCIQCEQVTQQIELPTSALRLLVDILAELAEGNAVRVVPIPELTTQEGADLLTVCTGTVTPASSEIAAGSVAKDEL